MIGINLLQGMCQLCEGNINDVDFSPVPVATAMAASDKKKVYIAPKKSNLKQALKALDHP